MMQEQTKNFLERIKYKLINKHYISEQEADKIIKDIPLNEIDQALEETIDELAEAYAYYSFIASIFPKYVGLPSVPPPLY